MSIVNLEPCPECGKKVYIIYSSKEQAYFVHHYNDEGNCYIENLSIPMYHPNGMTLKCLSQAYIFFNNFAEQMSIKKENNK